MAIKTLLTLIFTLLIQSCVSNGDFKAPKASNAREQIYADQELPARIRNLENQTTGDSISGLSSDISKITDSVLNVAPKCQQTELVSTPTTEDIIENQEEVREYIEESEPEYAGLSRDEKIKRNFAKLGGSSEAIDQALCFFDKNKDTKFHKKLNGKLTGETSIKNEKYMVVQDFTLPSSQKRFFLINLEDDPENGKKAGDIDTMYAPHGMGSKRCGFNPPLQAENFSNEKGCNLTPRGFMISGARGTSSYAWKWNMQLDGIQEGLNDNNRDRLVYFHPGISTKGTHLLAEKGRASSLEDNPEFFDKSADGKDKKYYFQNMTYGCTAVNPDYAEEVYSKTKGGALFYNFTPHEKKLGPEYCGSNLLTKE